MPISPLVGVPSVVHGAQQKGWSGAWPWCSEKQNKMESCLLVPRSHSLASLNLLFPVHGKFPSHVFLDILIFQADVFAFLW